MTTQPKEPGYLVVVNAEGKSLGETGLSATAHVLLKRGGAGTSIRQDGKILAWHPSTTKSQRARIQSAPVVAEKPRPAIVSPAAAASEKYSTEPCATKGCTSIVGRIQSNTRDDLKKYCHPDRIFIRDRERQAERRKAGIKPRVATDVTTPPVDPTPRNCREPGCEWPAGRDGRRVDLRGLCNRHKQRIHSQEFDAKRRASKIPARPKHKPVVIPVPPAVNPIAAKPASIIDQVLGMGRLLLSRIGVR
jgi:hypothetical protein